MMMHTQECRWFRNPEKRRTGSEQHITKRWIALLLTVLLGAGVLSACGATPDTEGPETAFSAPIQTGTPETQPDDESGTAETGAQGPDLPNRTYDDEIKVLHWTIDETWIPWEEVTVDAPNGDTLTDAVYERNTAFKESFGIDLVNDYIYTHDIVAKVNNMVATGLDEYQIIMQRGYEFQFLMTTDSFSDIGALPYVDVTRPWWNRDSVNTFTFGGVTLFAASDMLLLDKGATVGVFFNGKIAADRGWDGAHFYSMVDKGTWTLAELCAAAEEAYEDADGDQKVSTGDVFGAMGGDGVIQFMINGAGERFCMSTGDDTFLRYSFNERCYDVVIDTLDELLYREYFISNRYTDKSALDNAFQNDQCLFTFTHVKKVNSFRAMETAYGILPVPKYDEAQRSYASEISPHHDTLMAIPKTATKDDDRAEILGVTLEALSWISHDTVYPQLYDVVLSGKGTRDEESRQMLNLIFENRVYDIGIIFDFGNFAYTVLNLVNTGGTDVASAYEGAERTIHSQMDEVIGKLREITGVG